MCEDQASATTYREQDLQNDAGRRLVVYFCDTFLLAIYVYCQLLILFILVSFIAVVTIYLFGCLH